MKKSFIVVATLALMASSASAEQVRVVVSQDKVDNSFSVPANPSVYKSPNSGSQTTCLITTDGLREICVPTPNSSRVMPKSTSTSTKVAKQEYKSIIVDADSLHQVIETLNNTGWYNSVEVDVVVSTNTKPARLAYSTNNVTSQSDDAPNDPEYENQSYMHSEDLPGIEGRIHSHITKARNNVINKDGKVGVAVLDSGFAENDELQFTDGYSFVTSYDEVRDEDWGLNDGQERGPCGMHGFGVASTMFAAIDDGQTLAGVTNNVDSYALRIMNCGLGYLSDTADALSYLAKQEVDGAPLFTGNVQVANLSLGGKVDTCPIYMQSAIDTANEAGITVVVAAGNFTIDAAEFTPANCDGVLVVGALKNTGEKSSFSNYGDKVNVTAQGEDILGFGVEDKEVYWWEGTSFSAPLVSASIALAKLDSPSITPSTMRWLAENTTTIIPDVSGECETLGCGSGIFDANALVLAAQKAEAGDLSSIRHVLSNKSTCDQQWYVDHFGDSAKLCSMYLVTFFEGLAATQTTFKLIRATKGENIETGEELLTSNASSLLLESIDTSTYDYGFKTCQNGKCSVDTYTFTIDAEKMAAPTACN